MPASRNSIAIATTLRQCNALTCHDGTPLNHTLVNIKDWCKNTFMRWGQQKYYDEVETDKVL
jgi:hypothetical protein